MKLQFETDGKVVHTHFTPRPEHVGFKQTVHGGITATLLDEIMVWACAVQTKRFAYCAELTVRFTSPLRPGEEVIVTGELKENRRDKIFEATAEVRNKAGQILAGATGKYIPVRNADLSVMQTDLIGDTGWLA
jgi:uncharacterized protein (TIGR00369 family)